MGALQYVPAVNVNRCVNAVVHYLLAVVGQETGDFANSGFQLFQSGQEYYTDMIGPGPIEASTWYYQYLFLQ